VLTQHVERSRRWSSESHRCVGSALSGGNGLAFRCIQTGSSRRLSGSEDEEDEDEERTVIGIYDVRIKGATKELVSSVASRFCCSFLILTSLNQYLQMWDNSCADPNFQRSFPFGSRRCRCCGEIGKSPKFEGWSFATILFLLPMESLVGTHSGILVGTILAPHSRSYCVKTGGVTGVTTRNGLIIFFFFFLLLQQYGEKATVSWAVSNDSWRKTPPHKKKARFVE